MPTDRRRLVIGALAGAAFALALWRLAAPPAGPVEPAWDRVPCTRCRMLVSDRRFAAQLHTASGTVLFFDDPGCLLLHRAESSEPEARAWFHDAAGERWLSDREVGFVRADETPMGYGLAAAARAETPAALGLEAALATLGEPRP